MPLELLSYKRMRTLGSIAVLMALTTAGAACTDDKPAARPTESRPSPTSSAPTPSPTTPAAPQQAVLTAYDGYWKAVEQLDDIPASNRSVVLRPYAVDPAYTRALTGYLELDQKNQKYYGVKVHRPAVSRLSGKTATVRDCADTSQYGLIDKKTGTKLNRGTPASLTEATLQQTATGVWQVANINAGIGAC